MDDAELFDRMHASLLASGPVDRGGSQRLAPDRARTASRLASCRRLPSARSSTASIYRSPGDLTDALDELASVPTRTQACSAWTVWVPERDREVADSARAEGHELDADPAAMVLELEQFDAQLSPEVEIERRSRHRRHRADERRRLRLTSGDFVRALGELPESATHRYAAVLGGQRVAGLLTSTTSNDCWSRSSRRSRSARTRPGERAHDACAARCARARLHDDAASRRPRWASPSTSGWATAISARFRCGRGASASAGLDRTLPEIKKKALRAE